MYLVLKMFRYFTKEQSKNTDKKYFLQYKNLDVAPWGLENVIR